MEGVQGGDLLARKTISPNSLFWISYYLLLKCPKLGIQLSNAGDKNLNCRILTVIFNQINRLRVPKYYLCSIDLFYTDVSISTSVQGCVRPKCVTQKHVLTRLLITWIPIPSGY